MRGRKPKPTHLHVVQGTMNATRHRGREAEPRPGGAPVMPKFLRGAAAAIWREHAAIGFWLTAADSAKLAVWCAMTAEIFRGVRKAPAARIAQWRAMAAELGFDPTGRTRLGVTLPTGRPDPGEEFFDGDAARRGNSRFFDDD